MKGKQDGDLPSVSSNECPSKCKFFVQKLKTAEKSNMAAVTKLLHGEREGSTVMMVNSDTGDVTEAIIVKGEEVIRGVSNQGSVEDATGEGFQASDQSVYVEKLFPHEGGERSAPSDCHVVDVSTELHTDDKIQSDTNEFEKEVSKDCRQGGAAVDGTAYEAVSDKVHSLIEVVNRVQDSSSNMDTISERPAKQENVEIHEQANGSNSDVLGRLCDEMIRSDSHNEYSQTAT